MCRCADVGILFHSATLIHTSFTLIYTILRKYIDDIWATILALTGDNNINNRHTDTHVKITKLSKPMT